jgi:DNA end-binding protein Ku
MAVWTGTLSFGLVSIPVKLYPATAPKDVRFHLVDPETGKRVRYKRVVETDSGGSEPLSSPAEATDESPVDLSDEAPIARPDEAPADRPTEPASSRREVEVDYDQLVRGYEVDKGRFVTFRPDELEQARPERSRSVDIEDFVDLRSIDPVYFEKSYYLAPQATGEKPYVLLLRAMKRAGLVGIGRFVLRTKPHLVAIRPLKDVLGLETLYFADEVRPADSLVSGLRSVRIGKAELDLAEQLIDALRTEWISDRYADEYREELLRMISERSPSIEEAEADQATSPSANLERLMDALKASVEAAKKSQASTKKRSDRRRAG